MTIFKCDLCEEQFCSQFGFFSHLKIHYSSSSSSPPPQEIEEIKVENNSNNDTDTIYETIEEVVTQTQVEEIDEEIIEENEGEINDDELLLKYECAQEISNEATQITPSLQQNDNLNENLNENVNKIEKCEDEDDDNSKVLIISSVLKHPCEKCSLSFTSKRQKENHVKRDHSEKKKKKLLIAERKSNALKCIHCNRVFNHKNSLVYHLRSHTGERPHECTVCSKRFFSSSALKVHLRLHSGDKPYACEACGRTFRQWGDLKYHSISIHSMLRQYQCEFCGKDFARKYSLIVHRRIHTGERNYPCEYCDKRFRAASYLQNHRRIHTGEKPHTCSICGKPFRVRSDMKRHLTSHSRHKGSSSLDLDPTSSPSSLPNTHLLPMIETDDRVQVEVLENGELGTIRIGTLSSTSISILTPHVETITPHLESIQTTTIVEMKEDGEEVVENSGGTLYVWPLFMS